MTLSKVQDHEAETAREMKPKERSSDEMNYTAQSRKYSSKEI